MIIGAGASGLMAAVTAARLGAKVTVLEGNDRPGRKLLASGNGKCNLTNLMQDPQCWHSDDPAFVDEIIGGFPADSVVAFFTSLGLLVMNRDGWVYPVTEQSQSVLNLLLMEAEHLGVRIKTREHVNQILPEPDTVFSVRTGSWTYQADRVIVACGSPASAVRGSSGDAGAIAGSLGIQTAPFLPSLVPLRVRGDFCGKWAGVRVHASVRLLVDGKIAAADTGTVQLTDYGISGIPVLQVSHFASAALEEKHDVRVLLDLYPDGSQEELLSVLSMRQKLCPYKSSRQLLSGLIPEQLIPVLCGKNDTDLAVIAEKLKNFRLSVTGCAGLSHAQVCSGGILTSELNLCMESTRYPGLFFAGEAVNVDGACGGYNLQWAWSSGYTAGKYAAGK